MKGKPVSMPDKTNNVVEPEPDKERVIEELLQEIPQRRKASMLSSSIGALISSPSRSAGESARVAGTRISRPPALEEGDSCMAWAALIALSVAS